MKLIVISDPVYFKDEARLINRLFEAGMSLFHLRKEGFTRQAYAALIAGIDECYHDRIAMHQFHELAGDFPLIKRLHYPEWLRKETIASDLAAIMDNYTLSTSIHHLANLKNLAGFAYTFYGPVFNSISKPGYTGTANTDFVLPEHSNHTKVIALGGITAEKIEQVKQMDFDGFAVLGAIWSKKEEAVNNLKKLINKSK
ncbi:MAG: thiamine phosphate synthase [Candidatus Pedobacter colombiensis]|uniref:Thiamine phosphate synthase n=1 Tax=Candidatus Pedobacter colombiensis TaxID=3121371 RepID=A0AAJ5W6J8_9SPHI|nr:thiamine phosphate synthase [Pedobacter sp.]WEK17487.1 MAG: thiamine phosphate synthase [Pedobacter sp.]